MLRLRQECYGSNGGMVITGRVGFFFNTTMLLGLWCYLPMYQNNLKEYQFVSYRHLSCSLRRLFSIHLNMWAGPRPLCLCDFICSDWPQSVAHAGVLTFLNNLFLLHLGGWLVNRIIDYVQCVGINYRHRFQILKISLLWLRLHFSTSTVCLHHMEKALDYRWSIAYRV